MSQDAVWPTHAYIPGKTSRHAEDTFDSVRETARAGLNPAQLAQSPAFQMGLRYLEAGFYWEAHEVFEPVWMALPDPSRERQFVQGLIQIANGFLKLEMERPKAAARLEAMARELMPDPDGTAIMGMELHVANAMIDSLREEVGSAI